MVGKQREAAEDRAGSFDLIVIGAGINGTGIARDAALRGLRVLLLDKGDLAGGTTSWSTRLIHGGLRYLEHREVGLVRESLRERERLLRSAPHLVKPLPLVIPIYRGDRRGPWLIRAGMIAYDLLSFDKSLDRHRMLARAEALARVPGLNPDRLAGAAVYFDAQVEYAERLAVENAIAARASGATVQTYCRVDRLIISNGIVHGVEYTDLIGGRRGQATAPVTLNVTGPWVDSIVRAAGVNSAPLVGGTKGSHIVVAPFPGAPADALYAEAKTDGRPYFVIPWNDLYLIGTTDTRYSGDLDRVEAEPAEIDYLIAETNRVLPGAGLDQQSVLYTYAGVRPLPFTANGRAGAITRRHILHDHADEGAAGLFSVIGGKLTTYRNLAEYAVDRAGERLRRRGGARTTDLPLPGATVIHGVAVDDVERRLIDDAGIGARSAAHLAKVYGTRAIDIAALAAEHPDLATVFDPVSGAIGAEVILAVRDEEARTLSDVLLRRTMVGLGPDVGLGAVKAAAEIAGRHLGWDPSRLAQEVADYRSYVARLHPRALAAQAPLPAPV